MKAIILAGGPGDRLWPLSRKNYPKQFLRLNEGNSLFQETITRNIPYCDEFYIITNATHEAIVENQMNMFQGVRYSLILEEQAKGTAPALAFVSQMISSWEDILVLPADLVLQKEGYSEGIYEGKELAKEGKLVLFGIPAQEPNTSYGYIRHQGTEVVRFLEKPTQVMADKIFADNDILWNSGIILCRNDLFQQQLEQHAKSLFIWSQNQKTKHEQLDVYRESKNLLIKKEDTEKLERTHIEKVLLEYAKNVAVVNLRCNWQDVSNFDSEVYFSKEIEGQNAIVSSCDNTSVINIDEQQLVVANGLKDVLIVNTKDAIYITDKESQQDIKGIIANKPQKYREFFNNNPKVYRNWGVREVISQEMGFRVRRVTIYPGKSISMHSHKGRTESYSVVKGELSVDYSEGDVMQFFVGESVTIPVGKMHRLYNASDQDVVVIEVDTGEEIDEEDMLHLDHLFAEDNQQERLPDLLPLEPAYKDYLWGGNRLVEKFGKNSPYEITAEAWELSAHKDGQSIIQGGQFHNMPFGEFVSQYGARVCGWKSNTFDRFPILVKFIDAKKALSIQIHPFDDYAFVHENEFGKNEMWYVMEAEPGAYLYCGFSKEITLEEVKERIETQRIEEVLNKVPVKKGDVFFIPSGTIHAIGEGLLICEIQQNSNSTYRVYDYGRKDLQGNFRELHIEKALEVMSTSKYEQNAFGLEAPMKDGNNLMQQLCLCKYFKCDRYVVADMQRIYVTDASFVSLVFLSGEGVIRCGNESYPIAAGDSFFVTAGRKVVQIEGNCEVIATTI